MGFIISKLSFKQWYAQICMCGVRKLAYSMSKLGRSDPHQVLWYEPAFAFYWSVTIKYFIPSVLWFLLVGNPRLISTSHMEGMLRTGKLLDSLFHFSDSLPSSSTFASGFMTSSLTWPTSKRGSIQTSSTHGTRAKALSSRQA